MGLQIIYGRAHSGKSQYILNKAAELYSENKPLIVVVPEQFTHLAEKRLIKKLGSVQFEKAEILSFDRIAKRINSSYPGVKKPLGNVAKSLIMSEIISNTDFEYYKNISSDFGFVDVCMSEISEFKKYNMTYSDVFEASKKVTDHGLSLKLSDLAKIYQKYEESISNSYTDSDDALGILADNLEKYIPYSGYTFLFDEFSSFNPREKRIISILANQCEMVYMTFCADLSEKYKYLFKPTLDTAKSVCDTCALLGCKILSPITLNKTYYENEELSFLEKNIFSYPSEICVETPKNIRIYNSENPYTEITNLALQIKSLIQKKGIRYRDISVICADIDSYSYIFHDVFKSFDIPYFIDEKTDVLKHSILCFVVTILDTYLMGYNSETITNFLKSGHIDADRTSIIHVDNFIKATNASKNIWLTDEKWNKTLNIYCDGDMGIYNFINNIREKYILPLAALHDQIKGKNTIKYICEKLYGYLLSTGFENNISNFIKYFKENNNTYMAKQYESVWKILIEAMDMLVFILGDKKVNLSQFRKYLYTALSEQSIGVIPTSLDSVIIGDIIRSKNEFASHQFIVGAYDGAFPVTNTDKSIITDADKSMLLDAGFEFSPGSRDKAYFERFLTYSALTHPMKSLIISYPSSDSSFSPIRPSFTITLLKNIFPSLKEISKGDDMTQSLFSVNKTCAKEFLASAAYNIFNGKSADPHWQDIYVYFKNNDNECIDLINNIVSNKPKVTRINSELSKVLFKDEFYSTISRIQKYNSCRYSYYLEYMLGLKDKKVYGLESSDIGTFVHTIIEKSFEKMQNESVSIQDANKDYFIKITKPLFDEYLSELFKFSDELDQRELYKIDTIKQSVINALVQIKSHFVGSAFKPIGHEITFDDKNVGCIELKLNNGKKLKLTGKIDRADAFENENGVYIRVVDYKTGNKTFSISDVFYGLDIQLVVYLNTLVKNTKQAHHAGALFFKIQNPVADFLNHPDSEEIIKTQLKLNAMTGLISDEETIINAYSQNSIKSAKKATPTQFKMLSDYVESNVKTSAENLSNGYIDINPYSKSGTSPCSYCKFGPICGFKEGKTGEYRRFDSISEQAVWKCITNNSDKGGDAK